MITKKEYEDAIEALQAGMTQLEPDGRCCTICEDWGHQAFECHHNPIVAMKKLEKLTAFVETVHEGCHQYAR